MSNGITIKTMEQRVTIKQRPLVSVAESGELYINLNKIFKRKQLICMHCCEFNDIIMKFG